MKKFSEFIQESASLPEALTYVNTEDLKKYSDIASSIISKEGKNIITAMIEDDTLTGDKLLKIIRNSSEEDEHNIRKDLMKLNKYNRLIEIPVFQTPDQFNAIINQECTVDEFLFDFESESGRNKIAKQFDALVHKIANNYSKSSNLDYDELISAGYHGLVMAMNKYAKKERVKTDDSGRKKWVSFATFAAQQIRFYVLEDIKRLSHTVKIPANVQGAERAERGTNTKNYTVSGDEVIGTGSNSKTRFDTLSNIEDEKGFDPDKTSELWKDLADLLRHAFPKRQRDVNIFLDAFGISTDEYMKDVDIARKYGICGSNVTRIKKDILNFIKTNEEAFDIVQELFSYNESRKPRKRRGSKQINENKTPKYRICSNNA